MQGNDSYAQDLNIRVQIFLRLNLPLIFIITKRFLNLDDFCRTTYRFRQSAVF